MGELIAVVIVVLAICFILGVLVKGMVKTAKRRAGIAIICMIFLPPVWFIWSIIELFTDDIDSQLERLRPTEMMYIGTWMVFNLVFGVIYGITNFTFELVFIYNVDDFHTYLIVKPIVFAFMLMNAFIFTYNNFNALSVKRVFPWLVGIYGLGVLLLMWQVTQIDASPASYLYVISFFAVCYAIRAYYINKPDRWY